MGRDDRFTFIIIIVIIWIYYIGKVERLNCNGVKEGMIK